MPVLTLNSRPEVVNEDNCKRDEVPHKVLVIARADAIRDPGTVVIKARDASVTNGTVLRAKGLPHQASTAKSARVKTFMFGNVDYRLKSNSSKLQIVKIQQ